MPAPIVALLSNPRSTRNGELLPRIRAFVAHTPNVFHVELQEVGEVAAVLRLIARVDPAVLVVNGGDGTVQAVLTHLEHDKPFGDTPPPVAVLPNGKTNLIAADLGMHGSPIKALDRIVSMARDGVLQGATVRRHLIAIDDGHARRPVVGMFLGGAGLMNAMLFCRHKLYPLGLPNSVAHGLTSLAFLWSILVGTRSRYSAIRTDDMKVVVPRRGVMEGRFAVLLSTTLDRLLMGFEPDSEIQGQGPIKLVCIEQSRGAVLKAVVAALFGRLGRTSTSGIHIARGEEVRLEGADVGVLLDGEHIEPAPGRPLIMRSTAPTRFISLATA
jgi:hypothetical protein